MMWLEIIKAVYLDGYRLKVFFNDGESGIMDFKQLIDQYPAFKPLEDMELFRNFSVTDTIEWDCGRIDIAPEYVREHASIMYAEGS